MAYNLTNVTSSNDMLGVFTAVDSLTGGWFWIFTVATLMLIVFSQLKRFGTEDALMTTAFVGFVLSGLLYFAGMIGEGFVYACVGVLLVSIGMKIISA